MSLKLRNMVSRKLNQWAIEDELAAGAAIMKGAKGQLVKYPTGLLMVRWGDGVRQEVPSDVWERLVKNGGKVIK